MAYDFVIIGAGITGTILARELSRFDTKILLIEKENDVSMGATKANSAVVHGGYDDKYGSLKAKLCYKGRQAFEKYNLESSITSTAQIDFRPLYVSRIRKEGNVIFILCERFVQETQFTLFSDFKYLFRLVEMQGGDFLFTRCQPKRQASDKVNHSFHAAALFTYLLHNSRPP